MTHVISDKETKRTVIISENVDKKVQDIFARNGITYIDRKDPQAAKKIDDEVEFITRSRPEAQTATECLQGALGLRDCADGETIGEAIVNSSAETVTCPIFVSHVERPLTINRELLIPTKTAAPQATEKTSVSPDSMSDKNMLNFGFAKTATPKRTPPTFQPMSYAAALRTKKTR